MLFKLWLSIILGFSSVAGAAAKKRDLHAGSKLFYERSQFPVDSVRNPAGSARSCVNLHSSEPSRRILFSIQEPRKGGQIDDSNGLRLIEGRGSWTQGSETETELTEALQEVLKEWEVLKRSGALDNPEDELRGRLSLTNLPMATNPSEDFEAQIRAVLARMDLDKQIDVKVHLTPTSSGFRGLVERIKYASVLPQDYQRPIPEEIWTGLGGVLLGELSTAFAAFHGFPLEISIPMIVNHFGLLTAVTAFRQTVNNWQNRSASQKGRFMKQLTVSAVFIANFKLTANGPAIFRSLREQGFQGNLDSLKEGLVAYAQDQGLTTLIQTCFFWITFGEGLQRWVAISSASPEKAKASRRTASLLMPLIFVFTGPLALEASTSKEVFVDLGLATLNDGQAGLLGATALGSLIAAKPTLLDPVSEWAHRFFFHPLERWAELIRSWIHPEVSP